MSLIQEKAKSLPPVGSLRFLFDIENKLYQLEGKESSRYEFSLRVPVFERDWRVPLKKELGIDYRLDDTHYIEEEFFEEIR